MQRVGIVCDSTCDVGPAWLEEHGAIMVPLKVHFPDGNTYLDWVDLTPAEFYDKLAAAPSLPTTSQPSPADFTEAYDRLAADGVEQIVSIHLSSALSGTFQSATIAAETSAVPVHVIDTRNVSHATALVVKSAIEARDAGKDGEAIAQLTREATDACRIFFILDTLDYLVKGGRAGKATGLAAAVLNIKPVLTFNNEGIIEPFKKVKGLRKAIGEVAAHIADESKNRRLRVALFHAEAPELAEQMREALLEAGVNCDFDPVGQVGSVIGTYAGPGAVGLGYLPVE